MTTRSYQSTKRSVRRSRRLARQTDCLAGVSVVRSGALTGRISFAA